MNLRAALLPSLAALAIGAAQTYLLLLAWAYIAAFTPVPAWLLSIGITGYAFRVAIACLDLVLAVVFSLPAALLILRLRPERLVLYLVLAVLPSFAWLNQSVLGNSYFNDIIPSLVIGWVGQLLPLPIAVWLVWIARHRGAPNNSFKPNPLRGSA